MAEYFPYKLDSFQEEAINYINKGDNVLICAHTGSGKTTIGEYTILHHSKLNNKVIYTTPIKALSNQIYRNLTEKYPNLDIGIHTGDIQINEEAQIIIMTTEILRNNLMITSDKNISLGAIIFDEVHYIKDKERGHIWEQSIISADSKTQLVLLSATLNDPEIFAQWITKVNGKETHVIKTNKRIIPLTYYINTCADGNLIEIMDNTGNYNEKNVITAINKYNFKLSELNNMIDYMSLNAMLPALFFCFSRKKCEIYAELINPLIEIKDQQNNANYFDLLISKYKYLKEDGLDQVYKIRNLIKNGVAYHHSGIHPILKEIIETMFSKNMLKILFATETFAVGINMPSKTVVFTGLTKFTGNTNGSSFRPLYKEEFQQMSGRAGRRGIDKKGMVLIMPFDNDFSYLNEIIKSDISNIKSEFKLDCNFILKKLNDSNNYYEKSLQMIDINYILAQIEKEIYTLESFNKIDLTKYKEIIDYLTLIGNKKNKFDQSMRRWEKDEINDFNNKLRHYKLYLENNNKIISLKKDYENNKYYSEHIIGTLMNELFKYKYIDEENVLTKKGQYAQKINECNPILLIEIIYSDLFDNLTFEEICACLVIFLDINKSEPLGESLDIKELQTSIDIIKKINNMINKLPAIFDLYDFEINEEAIYPYYLWASGADYRILKSSVANMNYIGDFIKDVLKLANILEKMCEIYAEYNLKIYSVIKDYRNKLIRSYTVPESLYVHVVGAK